MNCYIFVILILGVTLSKRFSDAKVCEKFSTFKIDNDDCQCSADGKAYCCEVGKCELEAEVENRFTDKETHLYEGTDKKYDKGVVQSSSNEGSKKEQDHNLLHIDEEDESDEDSEGSGSGSSSENDFYVV